MHYKNHHRVNSRIWGVSRRGNIKGNSGPKQGMGGPAKGKKPTNKGNPPPTRRVAESGQNKGPMPKTAPGMCLRGWQGKKYGTGPAGARGGRNVEKKGQKKEPNENRAKKEKKGKNPQNRKKRQVTTKGTNPELTL